jgi:hypothetical protein
MSSLVREVVYDHPPERVWADRGSVGMLLARAFAPFLRR